MGRLLPFIIVILVIIGLVVAVPILLRPDSHRAQVTQYLSQKLHRPVVIGKLDLGFFPPALRLHEVTVFVSDDKPLMQTEEVDASPDWSSLLHAQFVARALTFMHPTMTVRRRANGTWDWDEWLASASELSASGARPLHEIRVHDGESHWTDSATSQEIVLRAMEGSFNEDQQTATMTGSLGGLAAPATVTFEGKGHFLKSAQWAGDVRFAEEGRVWTVHLEKQGARFEAKGQSPQWKWEEFFSFARFYCRWPTPTAPPTALPIMMQDWKTHFTIEGSSTTFYHTASVGGGQTEVKGDVSPGGGGLLVHVAGAFQDVSMSFFASGFETLSSVDGKLTGITRFEVAIATPPWSGFSGQGSVEIHDGRYVFPPGSIKSLAKAHTTRYLDRKYPGFREKGLPFSKFRVHWQAKEGVITFDDALLNAGDVMAALAGRLDGPRHGVDTYIRLQINETSPEFKKEIPGHYIYGAPGHEQIQPIYGHLQGSWDDWTLRAAVSRKIPATTQYHLRTSLTTP